jgi:hypothetical protein
MQQAEQTSTNDITPGRATTLPRFYSVQDIAQSLQLCGDTIRGYFQDLPGVLKFTKGNRLRGKREYVTLRIPETLLSAFIAERSR